MELENVVMELIIHAGEARSYSMEALSAARKGDWPLADQHLTEAKAAAREAHLIQTQLIGADEGAGKIPVSLILVHAQDHLMNAMLCRDLVEELIYLHREVSALKNHQSRRAS
jgi:PTS system cellobiose-specific IIA component